ncbi:M16 family metallopeptidase [Collimonas humicola]|uniref:M16 family metallopeptidase n=1 Tax=Collimonas humicola TaxID=2825886 RepID=UPI001B8ABAF4|nr:pitrilysin family protein [Collimonas humicola]
MRFKLSTLSLSVVLALAGITSLQVLAADTAPATADASKANLPGGLKFVRNVEGIDEYSLPNGLRLLLVPDASKPTTTVNITYHVGSRYENYGETGMAHLLEHLMFKGSKAHPRLWEEMSQRGVNFNGTTWLDRTNYYETFAAKPETLAWAIAMEADRMVNSRISGEDLKTEFSVVRNEMEMNENNSTTMLIERITSAAYQWHNYGKSTIGARTDVENVNIPRLQAFWRKYYQPDNATLVVAGAFDAQQVLGLVAKEFGKIPRPARVIETTYTLDPAQDGERDVTVRRTGDSQVVAALYHTVPAAHPDYAATEALALILGDTPNGRLYKALVESKKAADVFSWAANMEEPGFLMLGASLRTEQNAAAAKQILLDVTENLTKQPITEAELARAKAKLESNQSQVYNDPEKFAVALSDNLGNGDWRLFFLFRDRVRALTLADVQRVANTWIKASNRTSGSFLPAAQPVRAPAPAKVDVAEQIKTFKPGKALAQAENFVTTPENIDKRTLKGRLGDGMQYALLPKTTRGSTVVLSMQIHTGTVDSLKGKSGAAELAAAMLSRGAGKLSHQQFTEELDKLKTKLQISGGATGVIITAETEKSSLPRVLDLLRDALREPTFSAQEFSQLVTQNLAQLEEERKDPQAIAVDIVRKQINTWPADDPRYYPSADEKVAQLKAAKVEDAKQFWQNYYGGQHAEVSLVGDFDPAELRLLLQARFGDWKAKEAYQRVPKPYQAVKAQALDQITPDKANAFYFASMNMPLSDSHPDYPALTMANYLLGGAANSRIIERIRQKDGVSYGGGSYLNASSIDDNASFVAFALFAPQNRTKLETGMLEEINRAAKEGFTTAEVSDGKKSLLQKLQLARSQDNQLAGELSNNLYLGRSIQFDAEIEKKIAALTPAQVNAALAKYLSYDKLVTGVAGDFK